MPGLRARDRAVARRFLGGLPAEGDFFFFFGGGGGLGLGFLGVRV